MEHTIDTNRTLQNDSASKFPLSDTIKRCYDCQIHVREYNSRVIVATTLFLAGYDESICNVFHLDQNGDVVIYDNGSVTDYCEVMGIDFDASNAEVERIMDKYNLTFDGKSFYATCKADETELKRRVNDFLSALFLLSKACD